MSESPVAVDLTVVVDKHGRVETIDTRYLIGVVVLPVAYLEGTVRTVALGNQTVTVASLVVGEEPVGLLACRVGGHRHIRGIEHIGRLDRVKSLALGILVNHKDRSVEAPIGQVLYGGRPHHLVATTVHRDQVVVRTIDIHTLLARIIGIVKHIGLSVGDMLPEGKIGISDGGEFTLGRLRLLGTGA